MQAKSLFKQILSLASIISLSIAFISSAMNNTELQKNLTKNRKQEPNLPNNTKRETIEDAHYSDPGDMLPNESYPYDCQDVYTLLTLRANEEQLSDFVEVFFPLQRITTEHLEQELKQKLATKHRRLWLIPYNRPYNQWSGICIYLLDTEVLVIYIDPYQETLPQEIAGDIERAFKDYTIVFMRWYIAAIHHTIPSCGPSTVEQLIGAALSLTYPDQPPKGAENNTEAQIRAQHINIARQEYPQFPYRQAHPPFETANPFYWQVKQQYGALCKDPAAESKKFTMFIENIIAAMKASKALRSTHTSIVHGLQDAIYRHLSETLPDDFDEEQAQKTNFDHTRRRVNVHINSEAKLNAYTKQCDRWCLQKLDEMFGIKLKDINDFQPSSLSTSTITPFFKKKLGLHKYRKLITTLAQLLGISRLFINNYKETEHPKELLEYVLEAVEHDLHWEEFDIDDKDYISQVYNNALTYGANGLNAWHIYFMHNFSNFQNKLKEIEQSYNEHYKRGELCKAFQAWSPYNSYLQTVKSQAGTETTSPTFTRQHIQSFEKAHTNKAEKELETAYNRALRYYTKVYPHPSTSRIIRSAKNPHKVAVLDLNKELHEVRKKGKEAEGTGAGKKNKNIIFARLYFVTSSGALQDRSSQSRIFVPVELESELPQRILTRNILFNEEEDYFDQIKKDYCTGEIIRGVSEENATAHINSVAAGGMNFQRLAHSEPVLLEFLRRDENIKQIVNSLRQAKAFKSVTKRKEKTRVKVYSILMLLYSSNSICRHCTPQLISLLNSYEADGFLTLLTKRLNQDHENPLSFYTRGYQNKENEQNPAKFSFNIIVTAATARDTTNGQAADAIKNPEYGLRFPMNSIDIRESPQSSKKTTYQPFFYEFIEPQPKLKHIYFASGK